MKKIILLLFTSFIGSSFSFSQADLTIKITGIRNETGVVMLQLLDEKQNIVTQVKGTIKGDSSEIFLKGLSPGKYAFRYFHDENLSGIMDKGALGIPVEGYGFSNDAYGMFGPKPFRDWLFELKNDRKIAVKIKYHQKD